MLKTIQNKLIHSLGGYTAEEYYKYVNDDIEHGFEVGIIHLAVQLDHIARQNYGCSKQEWIDKIYSKIQEALEGNVK